jgi:hypothetical protein
VISVDFQYQFLTLQLTQTLFTAVSRQVFWLSLPLPAFPFDPEQWHATGKGLCSGYRSRDYSGGTAPGFHGIPY